MTERTERQVAKMTDKDREELERLPAEERAERLARKRSFQLDNEHLRLITEDLIPDDDAGNIKLAKIIRDLVSFCVDGTADLTENIDEGDPADKVARKLLYDDCQYFADAWLLRSLRNTQNRQGKTKDRTDESQNTEQNDDQSVKHPTSSEVLDLAHMPEYLGGKELPDDEVDQIATKWFTSQNENGWRDEHGDPIRNWKKRFQKYCQKYCYALFRRVQDKVTNSL